MLRNANNFLDAALSDFIEALYLLNVDVTESYGLVTFYVTKAAFLRAADHADLDVATVFGDDRHNDAPTLSDFLTYADDSDILIGYVAPPPRSDMRVSIVGIETYDSNVACKLIRAAHSCPDEFIVEGRIIHLWWD